MNKNQYMKAMIETFNANQGRVMIASAWEPAKPLADDKIDATHFAVVGTNEVASLSESEWEQQVKRIRQMFDISSER